MPQAVHYVASAMLVCSLTVTLQGCDHTGAFLPPRKSENTGITFDPVVSGNTSLDCTLVVNSNRVECTKHESSGGRALAGAEAGINVSQSSDKELSGDRGLVQNQSSETSPGSAANMTQNMGAILLSNFVSTSCQIQGAPCNVPGFQCCSGLTCQSSDAGYEYQCLPPPCTPAGSTLQNGQQCCEGSMKYQANGGAWCAPLPSPTTIPPSPVPTGSLMLHWSYQQRYCISVQNNDFQNGAKVQLWGCHGSASGQHFQFTQGGLGSLIQVSAAPEYCVVISGNSDQNGAQIQLWQCDASVLAQQWTLQSASGGIRLRNAAFPNQCLVHIPNDGKNIKLWSCDDNLGYRSWSPAN